MVVSSHKYLRLTRAVRRGKTSSSHAANVFFDIRVVRNGIPVYVLTDNGVRITSKLFSLLCTMLDVNALTTTAYRTQTNGQVERNNNTIVTRRLHYVTENQKHRETYVNQLTYAYNVQVHKFTNAPSFSPVLARNPSWPAMVS